MRALIFALTLTLLTVTAATQASQSVQTHRFGMTEAQFDRCKELGKTIMRTLNARQSQTHLNAQQAWNRDCSLSVILDYAIQHNLQSISVPSNPRDWAEMD